MFAFSVLGSSLPSSDPGRRLKRPRPSRRRGSRPVVPAAFDRRRRGLLLHHEVLRRRRPGRRGVSGGGGGGEVVVAICGVCEVRRGPVGVRVLLLLLLLWESSRTSRHLLLLFLFYGACQSLLKDGAVVGRAGPEQETNHSCFASSLND